MKSITIAAAAWVASFRSWQDGDVFRESNIDLQAADIADRLGYLKDTLDGAGLLAAANAWAAVNTFNGDVNVNGNVSMVGDIVLTGGIGFSGSLVATGDGYIRAKYSVPTTTGADADGAINWTYGSIRVPTLTANRIWTLKDTAGVGTPQTNQRLRITKVGTSAFTLTIKRETGATTLCVFDASTPGWVDLDYNAPTVVSAWGGTISSISSTV